MEPLTGRALSEHFASLEDPRVERTKLHPLLGIVTIAVCAVISGAESWNDIEEFGQATEDFFAEFLELPGGIPHQAAPEHQGTKAQSRLGPKLPHGATHRQLRCVGPGPGPVATGPAQGFAVQFPRNIELGRRL